MDVISACLSVVDPKVLDDLRAEIMSSPVSVAELKNGLEDILVGDYPDALKEAVRPELSALRDLSTLGVVQYGTFKKKGDD